MKRVHIKLLFRGNALRGSPLTLQSLDVVLWIPDTVSGNVCMREKFVRSRICFVWWAVCQPAFHRFSVRPFYTAQCKTNSTAKRR